MLTFGTEGILLLSDVA